MRAFSRSSRSAGSGVLPNHRSSCPVTVVRVFDNPSLSFCNQPIIQSSSVASSRSHFDLCTRVSNFLLGGAVDALGDAKSAHGAASDEPLVHLVRDRSRINAKYRESATPQVPHQRNGVARGLAAEPHEQKSRHRLTMKTVDPPLPAAKMQGHRWEHFCPDIPDSIVAFDDPR